MTLRAILAIFLLAGLLAACGVRGKPTAPQGQKNTNDQIVLDPLVK